MQSSNPGWGLPGLPSLFIHYLPAPWIRLEKTAKPNAKLNSELNSKVLMDFLLTAEQIFTHIAPGDGVHAGTSHRP